MMIEVNLLPLEMRRVEHTPLPRFLIIIIGTALVTVTMAFAAVVNLRKVPDLREQEQMLSADIGRSNKQAAEYDLLVTGIEEVKERKQAIAEIWRARILWSEKLDQLSQMLPKFIGLENIKLEVSRRSGRDDDNGGFLTLGSICAGGDLERLGNVRRILEGNYPAKDARDQWIGKQFFADFSGMEPTPATRKAEPDFAEGEALTFDLKMTLKSDQTRLNEYMAAVQSKPVQKAGPTGQASRPKPVEAVSGADRTVSPTSSGEPVAVAGSGRAAQ